jgi:flagellar basal-body rod protein FlgG
MDKTLRTAATGLTSQQRYVEIISNNISNVNTTGFKKVRPEFQDLLYETLRPAGAVARIGVEPLNEVQIGSGTQLVSTSKNFGQGDITQTNKPYDMAINGEGFFMVRRPDNSLAFSRDGSFKVDRTGQIVNNQGYRLDPGITIPQDAVEVVINKEGAVSVLTEGSTEHSAIGSFQLARFVNPAGLRSIGDNLYEATPASGAAIFETPGNNNTGEIIQNYLETSNVDVVEEMVNMITAQRAYELNSKSVSTAESILQTAVNLKR